MPRRKHHRQRAQRAKTTRSFNARSHKRATGKKPWRKAA
jgi:hypothetical protein